MRYELLEAVTNKSVVMGNGITIVNTTPHPIVFQDTTGVLVTVPNDPELLVNARVQEEVISSEDGVDFVKSTFIPSEEGAKILDGIEAFARESGKRVVIIGSIIAAQAFPGRVFGMTPVPGFERVAPSEKRMSVTKFVTF